jgi:hypothetical protein
MLSTKLVWIPVSPREMQKSAITGSQEAVQQKTRKYNNLSRFPTAVDYY